VAAVNVVGSQLKPTHIPQKRGGVLGGLGYAFEVPAHIPQERGGAGRRDVGGGGRSEKE
jgi:hypothetical protein